VRAVDPGDPHVPANRALDERELRGAQGVVGAALLGAFVFRVPLLVVAITVVVAVGAVAGPRANAFHAAYRALLGNRLRPGAETVPASHARALDIVATVLLALACAALAVDIDVVAWLLVLVEAVIAVVAATTGWNAAVVALDRLRREQ
jgi:hypothetical protein